MVVNIVRQASIACLVFLALCAPALGSATWYVNAGAQSPFDGSSFAHGFQTIQQAIDTAADGDRINVAEATYTENLKVTTKVVELYGGYAGSDATTRDPAAYVTTIDGGSNGPAVQMTFTPDNSNGNLLDGFTIQNGTGMVFSGNAVGGGVVWSTYGTIRNCTFRNNQVSGPPSYGGAIGFSASFNEDDLRIENCTFTNNMADRGGAVAVLNKPFLFSVTGCTFDSNHPVGTPTGYSMGGALYSEGIFYQSYVQNNVFKNNQALFGGAITLSKSNNQTIAGNTFTSNAAQPYGNGGALYIDHSDPVAVSQNIFNTNTAGSYGGAIYADTPGATSVAINSNVFTGNVANAFAAVGTNGSGLVTNGAYVVNNTITGSSGSGLSIAGPSYTANNIVAFNGGGIEKDSGVVAGPLHNNDAYGNTGFDYGGINDPTGSAGNIKQDPLFVNRAGGDFHLQVTSPCIDAGNTPDAVAYAGTADFEGEARVYGPNVDIGADEFVPRLIFTTQPGMGRPGLPLNPQPVITVEDRAGQAMPGFSGAVTLAITQYTGADGATLSGTKTVTPVNGVAAFTDLSIDKVSPYYRLTASSPNLDNIVSDQFGVMLQRSYVKPSGNNALDGSSWDNAKASISGALYVTAGPDAEVWVARGTYNDPLLIPDGIMVYGGFAGMETDLGQRNTHAKTTIIHGTAANAVIRFVDSGNNGIDGFEITGGGGTRVSDTLLSYHWEGGGVFVGKASPRIANNLITGNSATYGGGISVEGGRPVITGNLVFANSAAATTTRIGAGGGIAIMSGNGTVLSDNVIAGNTVTGETSTRTPSVGGGMVISGTQDVHNNTFYNNQSPPSQGDIYILSGSTAFANNIIQNHAAIEKAGGTPTFSHNDYVPGVTVTSPLPNPKGSNGNISQAVTFVDPSTGNFHLPADSFLKDIGDIGAVKPGETDMDGQPRVLGAMVDIGADEIAVPYTLADAGTALAIAGGLQTASQVDALRLDWEAPEGIDALDAIHLVRKAAGLEANP